MKAVGIVAEYNPFHLGHAYQIAETRRVLGGERPVVCVMSGNWVQRGECALTDKWTRARLALLNGADLILELPLPWAISSAEGFAQGAVATLNATGVVDTLSFGSESGQVGELRKIAAVLESEEFRNALYATTDKGYSFAELRQKAVSDVLGDAAKLLENPNDNLGVEYIRAAGGKMDLLAIVRQGVSHNSDCARDGYASATYLRQRARAGEWEELARWTPEGTAEVLQTAGIAEMEPIERAMLARLRQMDTAAFSLLPDSGSGEGLPERLVSAAAKAGSLEEFYTLAKTKRYPHARLRRMALWAFLGLTAADRPKTPQYIRVLGFNDRGQALLREMKTAATLPILTKPAHIREFSEEAQRLFVLEVRATDLYGLCFDEVRPCGLDFTTGAVRL